MSRSLLHVLVMVALLSVGCSSEPSFETVDDLFATVGGQQWCDDDLRVTLPPFVGSCGDPTTDARVVLGISQGGQEIRASVDAARDHLTEDGQLLLVPSDPDQEAAWQLRSRDRGLLEQAQAQIGGVILDSEGAIDEWLDR